MKTKSQSNDRFFSSRLKNILLAIIFFIAGSGLTAFIIIPDTNDDLLGSSEIAQVGIIVKDIEVAAEQYAALFGMETPGVILSENPVEKPTRYMGDPTKARCKLAFINLDNIMIELIEPVGGPSTWRDFLDETGGGIHHIGIWVKDMETRLRKLETINIKEVQRGGWNGGRYSYLETPSEMGIFIELLENLNE